MLKDNWIKKIFKKGGKGTMGTAEIEKTTLPKVASPDIMELLIKAKHFFEHAKIHAESGNSFDTMISIHSLDNSIEYLLRIIIKHLEIEEKLSKTINTPELMAIYSEVDKFLKEQTLFNGKGIGLPFENEIRQLRVLRNNVQHGMVLPVSELKSIINYGDRFFEKVLSKVFGLTIQEISYSTLIEDADIKNHLLEAETKIASKKYLEAVVACRDAFELAKFLLTDESVHFHKMIAIPHIKHESMELYYYIQNIDEKIDVMGSNINFSDYKLYTRYVQHIPAEYRVIKSGYSVMQREWEKHDADFCYSFVAQTILNWQLNQEKPLYEIDTSRYAMQRTDKYINGVFVPEIYAEKSCIYNFGDSGMGEIILMTQDTKDALKDITEETICCIDTKRYKDETTLIREYREFVIVNSKDIYLVLNNGPIWEMNFRYTLIPFTTTSDIGDEIDMDSISSYETKNANEEHLKNLILEYGVVDTPEKAFELNTILKEAEEEPMFRNRLVSNNLIRCLQN